MTVPQSDDVMRAAPAAGPVELVEAALVGLRLAQESLDPSDRPTAETLATVAAELDLLGEEVAVQFAEIEAAGRARQDERELVRRLMSELPVPMLTTDVHGAVLSANTAAEQLLATPPGVLVRKPVAGFVAGPDRRAMRNELQKAVAGPEPVETVLRLVPRHGEPVRCRVTLTRTVPGARPPEVSWVFEPETAAGDDGDAGPRYRATLVELCRLRAADLDLRGVLRRVCELAVDGLPDVASVSVVLGHPATPGVVAASAAPAQAGDGLQHLAGQGPVFDAFVVGEPVLTRDVRTDGRWPSLARAAGTTPAVVSWLSVPLVLEGGPVGVVSLYGAGPDGLDAGLAERARAYVAAAQSLIGDRRALEELATVRDQLAAALTSRAEIDQAKGMIMLSRGCDADEAFALLVRMSNVSDRKVRDLARQFVEEARAGGGRGPWKDAADGGPDRDVSPERS